MKYQIRQWSRTAWGLAALFGSLPIAGRLLLGSWEFQQAAVLSVLFFVLGAYLEIRSRRLRWLRDDASALQKALALAAEGETERAISVLTRVIRLSPRLWQAYQYRGQLRLRQPEGWERALFDFDEAIRLAPQEAHLYTLRSQVHQLLGDDRSARRDAETAQSLSDTVS